MPPLTFRGLNDDWNAKPNAPSPEVEASGDQIVLRFYLNYMLYPRFTAGDVGAIAFSRCNKWRLGPTNDEGWYKGQCRYGRLAPEWGEFYELVGDDPARDGPDDWRQIGPDAPDARHFLFYLRNETFECMAADCSFACGEMGAIRHAGGSHGGMAPSRIAAFFRYLRSSIG